MHKTFLGTSFTANNCTLVYLVDEAGARTTTDTFHDLYENNIADTLFRLVLYIINSNYQHVFNICSFGHNTIEFEILLIRAGEPANFLAAPALSPDFFFQAAPAPDFFPKRLRLLIFFPSGSGSGSWYFFSSGSGS